MQARTTAEKERTGVRMAPFLAIVFLPCLANTAPGLQTVYCQAVRAWAPYRAEVREVRWCNPGECLGMGGAMFLYGSRVIAIDPQWPFKDNEVLLTMEHEYGHALGLPHRYGDSIMKPGWDPPFASGPTEVDFSDLRRIWGAKADLGGQHDPTSARGQPSRGYSRKANKPESAKKDPSDQILLAIANVHFSGCDAFTRLTQPMPERANAKWHPPSSAFCPLSSRRWIGAFAEST